LLDFLGEIAFYACVCAVGDLAIFVWLAHPLLTVLLALGFAAVVARMSRRPPEPQASSYPRSRSSGRTFTRLRGTFADQRRDRWLPFGLLEALSSREREHHSLHDYDELWREHGGTLWRSVYAFTAGRREVTDDAVTEAFARAMQYDGTIRAPVPWLFRTAFRIASREMKQERRSMSAMNPTMQESDTRIELMDVLRALPPAQRAALFLHYFADLPTAEIARRQGTTTAAIKVRLMRGRRVLRGLLDEEVGHER
jgi:RNA polymerase sigma factor (sigma-70 family)